MRVVDYTRERVGYFSHVRNDAENAKPVLIRLNIEELKKINGTGGYEKTPFNCNIPLTDCGGGFGAKPLEEFLIANDALDGNGREFNVLCRSSILKRIHLSPSSKIRQFSVLHTGRQTIIIEEAKDFKYGTAGLNTRRRPPRSNWRSQSSYKKNELDTRSHWMEHGSDVRNMPETRSQPGKHIYPVEYANLHLTMLPNEEVRRERKFAESNLYIVVKHRYRYDDGNIINLFISKEIAAVEFTEEGEEMVSIVLKTGNSHQFVNADWLELTSRKDMIMNYLADGICYIHGIMLGDNVVHKVVVMDSFDAVCDTTYLEQFKQKISDFLFTLATVEDRYMYNLIECRGLDVFLTNLRRSFSEISITQKLLGSGERIEPNELEYDPNTAHHLVIVGSCSEPVSLQNPLYHTDVVSIDNFCQKLFDSFMCEPQSIFVYGKK